MKKVVKVSIGNIAFTLEEGAYSELELYLASLSSHYGDKEGGAEIIEGIEERISELLLERGYTQKVVTLDAVKEIMSILGRPEEIESESESEPGIKSEKPKKKLYRDLQNKVLGGICSGIASYFAIDPTFIRIIAFILGLVAGFSSEGSGLALFILFYFALWIIIPGAKTVEQRCRMKGERASVDSIERRVTDGVNEIVHSDFGVTFAKLVRIFAGVMLLVIGVFGLGSFALMLFGFKLFDILLPFSTLEGMSIFSGITVTHSVLINVLVILVTLLPFVGMLYAGVLLSFNFKAPKWRPGLVNFLVWLVACIALVISLVSATTNYWECERRSDISAIDFSKDTLYIKYADVEKCKDMRIFVDADRGSYNLFYVELEGEKPRVVAYPELNLRVADLGDSKIKSECDIFPKTLTLDEWRGAYSEKMYDFDGTTLTLYPVTYDMENKVKVVDREVTIYLPRDVEKMVKEPVYHDFHTSVEYSDINFVKKYIYD